MSRYIRMHLPSIDILVAVIDKHVVVSYII
jgi:hypothetical protein